MHFITCVIVMLIAMVATTRPMSDGVTWESTQLTIRRERVGEAVGATFHFTNRFADALVVRDVIPSCGCISAATDKKVYGPGEDGQVTAAMTGDGGFDDVDRSVLVTFDHGFSTKLSLHVVAPPLATFDPPVLQWRRGDPLVARKSLFVGSMPGLGVSSLSLSGQGFAVSFERVSGTEKYLIWAHPTVDVGSVNTVLHVATTLYKDGSPCVVDLRITIER